MKVDVKGLSFNFGSKEILKNINLNVKNKEFVGIIGPNGSGKSTFLKCVYRVLNPPQGEIKINDKSIRTLSLKETAKYMAVVSQHNNNNFDFTVREMVLMGRSPHKKMMEQDNAYDYEIVEDSLRKVGMLDFVDRDFSTLSGGEQQRIILARALTQQPKSLILDEPTNHLDIKYQLHLLDVVKKLDITSIAAFHDLNIAAMYCDTIYALKAGEIIDYGTPEKILTAKLIKELYQVNATIGKTKEGLINIIYTPLRNH